MRLTVRSPLLAFLLLYAALYLAYGTESPFLPSYMHAKALTPQQIGYVFGAGTIVRILAGPSLGRVADLLQSTRGVLVVCAAASAAIALCYAFASTYLAFLAVSICHSVASAPLAPMADTLAVRSAGESRSFRYGWVRGAGSAAFIAGTLLAGQLIGPFELQVVVFLSAGFLAITGVAAAALPAATTPGNGRPERSQPSRTLAELFRNGLFVRTMIVVMLVIGSHALNDTFAVIRWMAAGIGLGVTSVLWSEAVLSEVVVFLVLGQPLLKWLKPSGAAALGAAAGCIRWIVMAKTTSLPALIGAQALHGLTFSLMHLVAISIIADVVPASLATTAQTAYNNLCLGLASAALVAASGVLYGWFGADAFFVMALLCAAAMPVAMSLRVNPGRPSDPVSPRSLP